MSVARSLLWGIAVCSGALLAAAVPHVDASAKANSGATYQVKDHYLKWLPGYDGTSLVSDIQYPVPPASNPAQKFPVLIFPNSWGCPEFEYVLRAHHLASKGFVTIEYATRGWWLSGGHVDLAGPKDRADGSAIIDWAMNHSTELNFDMTNVAFVGISYGAGISLLMGANDSRVTTVVAMSGWANLTDSLYHHESTSIGELNSLVHIANRSAHPSEELLELYEDMINHVHVNRVVEIAEKRGVLTYASALVERKVPVFLSNNYLDRIFFPQQMPLALWDALEGGGTKFMLNNCGPHAMAEAFGIVFMDNYIWDHATMWLQFWLQNGTGSSQKTVPKSHHTAGLKHLLDSVRAAAPGDYLPGAMSFQSETTVFDSTYHHFSVWPPTDAEVTWQSFTFEPRLDAPGPQPQGLIDRRMVGALSAMPGNASSFASQNRIQFPTGGMPPLYDGYGHQDKQAAEDGVYPTFDLYAIDPTASVVFVTPTPLEAPPNTDAIRVCGVPTMEFTINVTTPVWQVYAYLMEVQYGNASTPDVFGTIFSDTPMTRWGGNQDAGVQSFNVTFRTMCRTIAPGNGLAVGFALWNHNFATPNAGSDWSVDIAPVGAVASTTLRIPLALV